MRECSDSSGADANNKAPWHERKRRYIERLRQSSDHEYLLVCYADKLHNARAILQDHREGGEGVWYRFTEKGNKTPNDMFGYYYPYCTPPPTVETPIP